ncbi:RNA polymerase subunit sigma-24 [candidate division WOR-3 bacterium]|uniref:RNA polymerase sigma factor n=1 Tax=candidate division WOR-3 bacterium TaxID=2052148 RepID=A0A660SI66_UNCW3|nr:MAG: RNA polymerase subunit sigma-24 [candidate division WOR-3 bacterium]
MRDEDGLDIEQVLKGDYNAFNRIVNRYHTRVYAMIYRIVHNRSDAEDLTQETFIHAYRGLKGFDRRRPFSAWLYRIGINLTMNFLKKKSRHPMVDIDHLALASTKLRDNPVRYAEKKILLKKVEEEMKKLPEDLKTVLILRVNEEMSYEEIAQTLGISKGTVMSRLSRARHKLKEAVFGG